MNTMTFIPERGIERRARMDMLYGVMDNLDDGTTVLDLYFGEKTDLEVGKKIILSRKVKDEVVFYEKFFDEEYEVVRHDWDDYGNEFFSIKFPYRAINLIEKIEKLEDEPYTRIYFKGAHNIFQKDIWAEDGISGVPDSFTYSKNLTLTVIPDDIDGNRTVIRQLSSYDEWAFDRCLKGFDLPDDIHNETVMYTREVIDYPETMKGLRARFGGSDYFYRSPDGTFRLREGAGVYQDRSFRSFHIPALASNSGSLNREMMIRGKYMDRLMRESMPEFIDFEKVCFEPYYYEGNVLKPVKGIRINPHFRLRDLPGWNTDDGKYWARCEDGNWNQMDLNTGDDILTMGFTADDIRFRKNKVKYSFYRMVFYSGAKPLDGDMLYYSTIFLDTGEIFGKYMKTLGKRDTRIDSSFTIYDRYDSNKSSEGFYIYLLSDIIENEDKTIYMRMEFNHAGEGTTVPFIWNKNDFPPNTYIVDGSVNTDKFYQDTFIPITLHFDGDTGKYMYIFKGVEPKDGVIELNIFEPKIN